MPVSLKNTEYGLHPSAPPNLTERDAEKVPAKTFPAKIAAPKPVPPITPIPTGLVKPAPPSTVLNPKAEAPAEPPKTTGL